MAEFNRDYLEMFLGVIRKYMQVRGPMSQKELALVVEVGVSTMSRFLSQKSTDLNPQLIAKVVAKLNIPLHEIIDFVDEEHTDRFVKLVAFHRDEEHTSVVNSVKENVDQDLKRPVDQHLDNEEKNSEAGIREKFERLSPRQRAYLTDFLNLDVESRDLVVDLGNSLFRYFKQKGMKF